MHDYDSSAATGGGQCLSFKAGQVIRVYNRDPSGWWDGELEGRRGWFPSNYVSEDVTADISPAKAVSSLDSDEMKHLFME
jgi:son of sevenless-like protein